MGKGDITFFLQRYKTIDNKQFLLIENIVNAFC